MAGYDAARQRVILSFPSEEVKYGFINSLALFFRHQDNNSKGMPGLMRLTAEK